MTLLGVKMMMKLVMLSRSQDFDDSVGSEDEDEVGDVMTFTGL